MADEQMPTLETPREFRDPIHGFILVHEHEKAIIDTPEFQRLRRIRQLALSSYVYHGAEHTRFGHSLGVMHLAGEATRRVVEKNFDVVRNQLGWSDNDTKAKAQLDQLVHLARLSGLLHDIGHAPFSHAGEKQLFPDRQPGGTYRHEDYSIAIIRSPRISSLINQATERTGATVEDICEVLEPRGFKVPGFVREIISSPWDVDKMDYLRRDALYCGVEYGRYDLSRLVASLTLDTTDPSGGLKLAIEEGGVHALESLVLARYFMFTQVYFHKVRRAFDILLTSFIPEALLEITGNAKYPTPERIQDYLVLDDSAILAQAMRKKDENKRNLAWQIVARDHPKTIYSTLPHPSSLTVESAKDLYDRITQEFSDVKIWPPDYAEDHPEKFRRTDIPVIRDNKSAAPRSFARFSTALHGLEEIRQVRIYADTKGDKKLRGELMAFCQPYVEREM